MSSGCGDVLSLEDLKTAKKHQLFEAEVITGKQGGVASGVDIDYATNQVTGQTQKTMPAILRDIGFEPASFDFVTGGTLTVNDRNKAVLWPLPGGGDGDWYYWEGALPKVIPAASTPGSTGGVAEGAWRPVGDISLRSEFDSFKLSLLARVTGGTNVDGSVNYTGSGTQTLTDYIANRDISIMDFDAVGDGVADDTTAFIAAINSMHKGQALIIPSDKKFLVTSGQIFLKEGCSIVGANTSRQLYAYNGRGFRDFYDSTSCIIVSGSGRGIELDIGCSIVGINFIKAGLTFPATYAMASSWTGTAVYTEWDSVSIVGCTFIGFNLGIFIKGSRLHVAQNVFDCFNGIEITANFDAGYVKDIHMWPFATAHWRNGSSPVDADLRRNRAFYVHDVADWMVMDTCFSYGYLRGFQITNAPQVKLDKCQADGGHLPGRESEDAYGLLINGTSREITVSSCEFSAQDIGAYISPTDPLAIVSISNTYFRSSYDHGVFCDSGNLSLTGCQLIGQGTVGFGVTIAATNLSSKVILNGCILKNYLLSAYATYASSSALTAEHMQLNECVFINCDSPVSKNATVTLLATVASASPLILPGSCNTFKVTGNTNFGLLSGVYWTGRTVTLIFDQALTIVNSSSMRLAGSVNAVMTAGSVITLMWNGGSWNEVSRSLR